MKLHKKNEKIPPVKEMPDLKKELEQCKGDKELLTKQYLRALADYKNLEHRVEQERFKMRDSAKRDIIEKLLPIIDNLYQAEVFNTDPGLLLFRKSFQQLLQDFGVSEIEMLGSEYDPAIAEAVEAVEGNQDNIIIEVLQKAYTSHGTLIRHGKVKVSKKLDQGQ